jgi:hypothetical protein
MYLTIFIGIFAALIIFIIVTHLSNKKRAKKIEAEHPDAARLYAAKLPKGQLMFKLHKDFKGRFAYFSDGTGAGILLLPGVSYNILLQWTLQNGNHTTTVSNHLDHFVPAPDKAYVVDYDQTTKVFSVSENHPAGIREDKPQ